MISSVNYQTQTDLFANSLRSKLMSLSPAHLEYEKENPRGIGGTSGVSMHPYTNGITTCDDMMLLHMNQKSIFGMSYPPPTHQVLTTESGQVAIEMKFLSEPDLSNPAKQTKDNSPNGCSSHLFFISEKQEKRRKRYESSDDSDLFFDFDIEEEPRKDIKTIPYGGVSNENLNKYPFVKDSDSFECAKDNISSKAPSVSTAYGSIRSSPPVSDEEELGTTNDHGIVQSSEGFAIYPEDWSLHHLKSQNSNDSDNSISNLNETSNQTVPPKPAANETDVIIIGQDNNELLLEPDSNTQRAIPETPVDNEVGLGENMLEESIDKVDDSNVSSDEEESEEKELKVGSAEQKLANSKLMTLLSLLEKDRDYSKAKKSEVNKQKANKKHPGVGSVPNAHPLGASPVNFSFLRRSSKELEDISPLAQKPPVISEAPQDNNLLKPPPSLKRCESAPSLQESDVQFVISNEDNIPDTVVALENPTKDDTIEDKDESENNSDEEDDSRDKYRRCSSLKSGKTPPGSPSKRKIVR